MTVVRSPMAYPTSRKQYAEADVGWAAWGLIEFPCGGGHDEAIRLALYRGRRRPGPRSNAISVPVAGAAFGCALQRLLKGRRWRDGGFLRYMREPRRSDHGFDAKHDIPTHGLREAFYGAHGGRALAAFQACYHALGGSHALRDFALRQAFAQLTDMRWQWLLLNLKHTLPYLPALAGNQKHAARFRVMPGMTGFRIRSGAFCHERWRRSCQVALDGVARMSNNLGDGGQQRR